MQTMHPTLLIGPSDWDRALMPKEEFLGRIAALWRERPDAAGAIVFGSQRHHAELAWLTNVVPKLDQTVGLIPRAGEPILLFGGGANMIGSIRPLTWIENLAPLRGAGQAAGEWLKGLGGRAVLIGGDAMPSAARRALDAAAGAPLADATATLQTLMRRKSPPEMAALRTACAMLAAGTDALTQARRAGADVTTAMLAAEHAARRSGAQDVRTLFSLDRGRTLVPFETLIARAVDPLQAYLAVRHFGYWTEGFVHLSDAPHAVARKTGAALQAVVAAVKRGAGDATAGIAAEAVRPHAMHPVIGEGIVQELGLALDAPSGDGAADPRYVSVRVGATDGKEQHAIMSAVVAVDGASREVVWSS